MVCPRGGDAVMVGLAAVGGEPVLVGIDASSRVGSKKRISILFNARILEEAASRGWSVYVSRTGERVIAFTPPLFQAFRALIQERLDSDTYETVVDCLGSEIPSVDDVTSSDLPERIRRLVKVLARHYAFGKRVSKAYGGACAICGLNHGLVVAAHIFPVAARGSNDRIWNGIALCQNHHAAFDRFLVWIDPQSLAIRHHPDLIKDAKSNDPLRAFVASAYSDLRAPHSFKARPRANMFIRRYEYFENQYRWVKPRERGTR